MTETIMQKLLDNEELLMAMTSMPDRMNEAMIEKRREELYGFLWEHTNLQKQKVLNLVKEREQDFIDEFHEEPIPEWLMRLEGQDVFLEFMHQRFEEEDML